MTQNLTHASRVLYPATQIRKRDLAGYYSNVAAWLLPHARHRPLMLLRCPQGIEEECFFQKHPSGAPLVGVEVTSVEEREKRAEYMSLVDIAGLGSLVQLDTLEIHTWGSRKDALELPDRLVFDLDPAPDVEFGRVVSAAKELRDALDGVGLRSFAMATGGRGLHVVLPLRPKCDWELAKDFCRSVADGMAALAPETYTSSPRKDARHDRIFIDYLRNARGATSICPYSTRARTGAPVATPLAWRELTPRLKSNRYHVKNVLRRLAALSKDPWAGYFDVEQSLSERTFDALWNRLPRTRG